MSADMFLVVWCDSHGQHDVEVADHYAVHPTVGAAQEHYDRLRARSDVYSVSVCVVVESTDYPTHPLVQGLGRG